MPEVFNGPVLHPAERSIAEGRGQLEKWLIPETADRGDLRFHAAVDRFHRPGFSTKPKRLDTEERGGYCRRRLFPRRLLPPCRLTVSRPVSLPVGFFASPTVRPYSTCSICFQSSDLAERLLPARPG